MHNSCPLTEQTLSLHLNPYKLFYAFMKYLPPHPMLSSSGSWTLEELSVKLGAPKELLHRKLALWQQHGVLREEAGGRYYVVETGSSKEKMDRGVMLIDSDEERDSNTTTQSEQREEKLQVSIMSCSHSAHIFYISESCVSVGFLGRLSLD